MGSDSLDKPGQQRNLIENFQIYRNQALVYLQHLKLTWKPWIVVPAIVSAILNLSLMMIVDTAGLIWTNIFPSSFKGYLQQRNWAHIGFKAFSRILLALYALIAVSIWYGSPWGPGGQWPGSSMKDIPLVKHDIKNYFNDFAGATVCNIQAANLYAPPFKTDRGYGYCTSRADVIQAMSGGGRHGFGTPYVSNGCHYRWYSAEEICTILDRFDALVLIGDQNLEMIYAGFNTLLRKDLRHGALGSSVLVEKLRPCECNHQFTDPACHEYFVHDSKDVTAHWKEEDRRFYTNWAAYTCQRIPHAMLRTDGSPASAELLSKFLDFVRPAPPSNYKPIPIIHSVTNDASIEVATRSLAEFLELALDSKRKTPMLWIGPTAAGHIDIKGRKGNQEIWRFATEMTKVAKEKDVETLGLWNLTVQADSYDGKGFGEDVSIVAAMMVINWLARLESS